MGNVATVIHLIYRLHTVNTLRPTQIGRHFPDVIYKWIFFNENVWISIKISLKFVPWGPINSIPSLVQIMTWPRPGDKPLSAPMMVYLPKHICVSRHQWVKMTSSHNLTTRVELLSLKINDHIIPREYAIFMPLGLLTNKLQILLTLLLSLYTIAIKPLL